MWKPEHRIKYRSTNARRAETARNLRRKNPEKFKEGLRFRREQGYNKSIPQRYAKLLHDKKNNIRTDLSLEQYTNLLLCGCHYCGCSIIDYYGSGLDRVDNLGGYTKDNVLPCCGSCNSIRGLHLSVEEMECGMKAVLLFRQSS